VIQRDQYCHQLVFSLASGTDIELVSQFMGVSVQTIRKVYRHALPGIFDPILEAAHTFGR
jgi:hypothetical protein